MASTEITPEELQKVRNRIAADHARGLDTNSGLAASLTADQIVIGDWRYTAEHSEQIAKIESVEIVDTAKKYFVPENSVIVDLARPPGSEPPAAPKKKGGAK